MAARNPTAMEKALDLIIGHGRTAAEAARATGVSKGAISKNRKYRAFRDVSDAAREAETQRLLDAWQRNNVKKGESN